MKVTAAQFYPDIPQTNEITAVVKIIFAFLSDIEVAKKVVTAIQANNKNNFETTVYNWGTFDVVFSDNYDEDMGRFISKFPALNNVPAEKAILSQWVRPELIEEKPQ